MMVLFVNWMKFCIVKPPEFEENLKADYEENLKVIYEENLKGIMQDLAILTGGRVRLIWQFSFSFWIMI